MYSLEHYRASAVLAGQFSRRKLNDLSSKRHRRAIMLEQRHDAHNQTHIRNHKTHACTLQPTYTTCRPPPRARSAAYMQPALGDGPVIVAMLDIPRENWISTLRILNSSEPSVVPVATSDERRVDKPACTSRQVEAYIPLCPRRKPSSWKESQVLGGYIWLLSNMLDVLEENFPSLARAHTT